MESGFSYFITVHPACIEEYKTSWDTFCKIFGARIRKRTYICGNLSRAVLMLNEGFVIKFYHISIWGCIALWFVRANASILDYNDQINRVLLRFWITLEQHTRVTREHVFYMFWLCYMFCTCHVYKFIAFLPIFLYSNSKCVTSMHCFWMYIIINVLFPPVKFILHALHKRTWGWRRVLYGGMDCGGWLYFNPFILFTAHVIEPNYCHKTRIN